MTSLSELRRGPDARLALEVGSAFGRVWGIAVAKITADAGTAVSCTPAGRAALVGARREASGPDFSGASRAFGVTPKGQLEGSVVTEGMD